MSAGEAAPPARRGLELALLAAALLVTTGLLARLPGPFPDLSRFQPMFAAAFGCYALALNRMRRYEDLPFVGAVVIATGLGARIAFLGVPPILSDDLYRYLWEGRVLAHGMNPWAFPPDHPALTALRDPAVWPRVNHPELSAIYPPLSLAGYAFVSTVSYSVGAARLWVLVHEAALMLVLAAALRRTEKSEAWVAAYAWNPLAIVEFAGAGHNDPTSMLWLAVALLLAERRPVGSALAFSAAVLTKLAPLLALPFLWRGWSGRARITCVAVAGGGLLFYGALTRGVSSGLGAYVDRWRNNELLFDLLARWGGSPAIARLTAVLLVIAAIAWGFSRLMEAEDGARLAIRTGLLTGPVMHPWYLGWELMFQPYRVSWPWLLLSLTVLLGYGPFRTPAERASWHAPLGVRLVEYGIPLAAALFLALRSRKR